jgi:hypothetical protein
MAAQFKTAIALTLSTRFLEIFAVTVVPDM